MNQIYLVRQRINIQTIQCTGDLIPGIKRIGQCLQPETLGVIRGGVLKFPDCIPDAYQTFKWNPPALPVPMKLYKNHFATRNLSMRDYRSRTKG